ncbi:hypothetical protein [Microcystis aeruginosa]|uniref:hypothetical protein n=1 Tax=Microcystis aeruginosa TaxID=1126 RepID=UPI001292F06B|nr:hypothetical protein [Microcystis aeruginosa]MDB9416193.1 hypothetical protein [Microcystis aeruginosa CS-556/03]
MTSLVQLSVISYQLSVFFGFQRLAFGVQLFEQMVFDDRILLLMRSKLTAAGLKIPVT